jgi:phosphoribosyl isomerase A
VRSARLEILPAVDVARGQAVRLVQGRDGSQTEYGSPLDAARSWVDQGAEWIHLVDLDAAFGRGSNAELLSKVIAEVSTHVKVELSGGIRDDASLAAALKTGCTRVNLGTAALEDPQWTEQVIADHGEQIAVGLDVRGHVLAARGWTKEGGDLWETLARLDAAGCARYVVTDVHKDGTMRGPNIALLADVCRATNRPVVASGGIARLEDLQALAVMVPDGIEGAIVGRALYDGAFSLAEALSAVAQARDQSEQGFSQP